MPPIPARRRGAAPRRARAAGAPAAALLACVAAAACGRDPLEAASINNVDTVARSFVVYPFSTAPAPLNTAISVAVVAPVRPAVVPVDIGGGLALVANFDFAVDRVDAAQARLIPSKLLAGLEGTGRPLRNGVRVVDTPFDSLASAPDGAYQRDSATVVTVGRTFVVETEPVNCIRSSRTFIYAKFVVDSISPTTGGIYLRTVVDPNCGYRSLRPGRPTS